VPYVEQVLPTGSVLAEISSPAAVVAESPVSCFVSISNVKDANLVRLSFTVDGTYLDLADAVPLGGFSIWKPLTWEDLGDNLWKGAVELMKPGNISSVSSLDILEIKGVALDKLGSTTVTLTDFSIWGLLDGKSSLLPSEIIKTNASTEVVQKAAVYSKYDLNQDGIIDELDLSIAIYFYLKTSMEPGWDTVKYDIATAKDADVTGDNIVNLADLIEIAANFGAYDPYA